MVVIECVKRVDSVSSDGFADMEVRASSIYMAIPLYTKALNTAQISFLCQFLFLLEKINRKSQRLTVIPSLAMFITFMEKVKVEVTRLITLET